MSGTLGKIVRLNDDGTVPADNPFASRGGVAAQIWSIGHRNPLGIAFDGSGRLWDIEMGPKGGDELNLVERGRNYGYPIVSNGDHYDGKDIPDHPTRPEFEAPKVPWTPVISPGDMIFYSGSAFPGWRGDILVAGLSSKALIRVDVDGTNAREAERFDMGKRIREVEQGPDGSVYLLEDGEGGKAAQADGGALERSLPVIARSVAKKQSGGPEARTGLLRFARNDGRAPLTAAASGRRARPGRRRWRACSRCTTPRPGSGPPGRASAGA